MKSTLHTLPLAATLLLAACGGMSEDMKTTEAQGGESTLSQAIDPEPPLFSTAYYINNCRYALWAQKQVNVMYPGYEVYVTREASSGCTYQKTVLGVTYAVSLDPASNLRMVAGLGQLAVYYTNYPLRGFNVTAEFFHVEPSSLSVVRRETLSTASRGSVLVAALRVSSTGDFIAQGSKTGTFADEPLTSTATQFTATYPQFFTSTLPPTIRVY